MTWVNLRRAAIRAAAVTVLVLSMSACGSAVTGSTTVATAPGAGVPESSATAAPPEDLTVPAFDPATVLLSASDLFPSDWLEVSASPPRPGSCTSGRVDADALESAVRRWYPPYGAIGHFMGRPGMGSLLVGVTGDSRAAESLDLLARAVETCDRPAAADGTTGHVNLVSFPNLGDETIAIAIAIAVRLDGEAVAAGLAAWTRRGDVVLYALHTNGSGPADAGLVEWAMTTMLARLESK